MRTVSLRVAIQEFSKPIREVEHGESFLITRRGRPIARLAPHKADKTADLLWAAAHRQMTERMEEGVSLGGLKVRREDLHDR